MNTVADEKTEDKDKNEANNKSKVAEEATPTFEWPLLKRFLTYVQPYRTSVIIGLCAIPFSLLFSILFPWLIIRVVDEQLMPKQFEGLLFWITLLGLVLLGNYLADALYSYFIQRGGQGAIRDMRREMLSRVLHFPNRYFDKTPIGVTLTRLTSDLEAINESLATGLLNMLRDLLITIALLAFLFYTNWQLSLVVLLVGVPIYLVIKLLRGRLRDALLKARIELSQGTGYLQECLNGMKTVQLYSAEDEIQKKYEVYTHGFMKIQSRANWYDAALYSIIDGLTMISMGLVIWYGATQILAEALTVGVLVGFIHTLDKIFVPVRDFTAQIASIQRSFAAFQHVDEIFTQDLDEGDLLLSPTQEQSLSEFVSLEFDNVKFRYSEDGPYVLQGVSFVLRKGQKLALVGSTGSGKSTILRLLTKTYDNYEGSIRLNGIEITEIPKTTLGKFFSLMQQEVFLFNESIAFNVSLGRDGVDHEQVKAAANYVYANEFIEALPGGLDFELQNNGSNLSAGQGQLIAFARAIASGSEVIMLDEATSAVDSVTESLIQKAIDHVFEEKTVIAIAHRLSTIQHSDEIMVLDQGQVVESGSHGELVELGGFYAKLLKEDEFAE